ncbi:HD-GYP domain-containing protein [Marinitoga piezophila KA3]|uniref:HD-GYP domain-containing protein n=1 Tax=Marinitoga piezophila (strain DSM 14283 / JCM 11233 / KA3) TaxID=443254 RepID=H2J6X3_MARPK|nr:HD domain-containing phosphohydrolase [Marinitoga piezophila]AEX85238.1 HD-GYP domain-containing protein [Marinitoga piezophila KA3]
MIENVLKELNQIIAKITLKDFRFILGIKLSDNLFKIISYYDSKLKNYDIAMENMYFSVEDKFKESHFNIVKYEESINKHFFEGIENYFAIGELIKFRNKDLGFIYFIVDQAEGKNAIMNVKKIINENAKQILSILLDIKDDYLKEYAVEQNINSLLYILKAHDAYTYYHSLRISELSLLIAENLKLDQKDVEKLFYASLIHDFGEIWIPKSILQKSGKLTPSEIEEVKKHTYKLDFLFAGNDYFSEYVEIAKFHHEFLDGSGYNKRMNNEIPFLSRILAVAEVTDALLSNRPWRKALSMEEAIKVLSNMAKIGKLDKDVVDIVIKIIPEFYGGLYQTHTLKYKDIYLSLDVNNQKTLVEAKVIDAKKDYITLYVATEEVEVNGNIINISNEYLTIDKYFDLEYYVNNMPINTKCKVVGRNKLGYIAKIDRSVKDDENVSIKWNLTGIGIPLKKVIFVNKYVWRLDNEKAFKAHIETISNKNIVFYALKEKIDSMAETKMVINFEAFSVKVNLIGEIINKQEIFTGYYHCDFRVGEITDEEYYKLLQVIELRMQQIKSIK